MSDTDLTNPKSRELALLALGSTPGWPIYCARFGEIIAKEIDAKIFDLKTTDEDRRTLVAARELLTTRYTPEKIRETMLSVARNEVARLDRVNPSRG